MKCPFVTLILLTSFIYISTELSGKSNAYCKDIISKSKNEGDLINIISNEMEIIKNETSECINELLITSHYKALEHYVTELNKRGIRFRETLSNSINYIQKTLEDIHNKFRFEEKEFQVVSPAFQWAQSLDNVFIEVKFAHRHDSPGCLEVENLNVKISNNNIHLNGYCVLDDIPIKFELSLNCLDELEEKGSIYEFGSVGRYQMTLKKKEKKYWGRLLKDENEYFRNMKIWFEMKNKFTEELKDYEKVKNKDDEDKSYEDIEKDLLEAKKKTKEKRKGKNKERNKGKKGKNKKQEREKNEL